MLNRSCLLVRAKQPFLDWLHSLPDDDGSYLTLEEINEDAQVYLLPDAELVDDAQSLIRAFSPIVFELELEGWWTEESDWPQDRSYEIFSQWFEVSLRSLVHDLVDEPLIDDEAGPPDGSPRELLN